MADRKTLLALAASVEQAQGPDRALDADITLAVNPELGAAPWERVTYPSGRASVFADRSDPDNLNVVSPPRFTASLDAARTVSNWVLLHASDIGADGLPLIELGNPATTPSGLVRGIAYGGGEGALVRAYLAAALRARAEDGNDG